MVTYAHCIILLYYELLFHYYNINKEVFLLKKKSIYEKEEGNIFSSIDEGDTQQTYI